MGIRYSGVVRQINVDIVTALDQIAAGGAPSSTPLGTGEMMVRPVNATAPMQGGAFRVDTEDDPNILDGYRLLISARLPDPCSVERERVRQARVELNVGRRDGVSQRALAQLETDLQARKDELDVCTLRNGLSSVDLSKATPVLRSFDLFRTGNAVEDDLRGYVRVLDPADRRALADEDIDLPEVITNNELTTQAQAGVPAFITVKRVFGVAGGIRVDFSGTRSGITADGHMVVGLRPSTGHNFRRLIDAELLEADFHGLDEIFEPVADLQFRASSAVRSFAGAVNSSLVPALRRLFERGATVTLIGIGLTPGGIRFSAAAGILLGGRTDPCQSLRDQVKTADGQVRAAIADGQTDRAIAAARAEAAQLRRELAGCLGPVTPPPPEPPPTPPKPEPRPVPPPRPGDPPRHEP